jgi:hypothetical protein
MTMLIANVIPLPHPSHVQHLQIQSADVAAVQALMTRAKLSPMISAQEGSEPKLTAPDESRPELVWLAGNRHHGAQVEIGALGGGREDAPSLVHVGIGFDF